jgi:hypothetical protein
MVDSIFESFVKQRLPREDDKQFFVELYEIYEKQGKDALVKHLKDLIDKVEE